ELVAAAARKAGVPFVAEGYIDLDYDAAGKLVIERVKRMREPADVARRAVLLACEGSVPSPEGPVTLAAQSLCVHGDAPNAPAVAKAVPEVPLAAGVELVPLARLMRSREEAASAPVSRGTPRPRRAKACPAKRRPPGPLRAPPRGHVFSPPVPTLRRVGRAGFAGRGTPSALSTGRHARCPSPTRDRVSGRPLVGHRDAQYLLDGGHALRHLGEPALSEALHPGRDRGALQVERGRTGQDLLAQLVPHRHDLVEGDAAPVGGAAASRAPRAVVGHERLAGPAELAQHLRRHRMLLLALATDHARQA